MPQLTDKGIYIASESSFYRILKSENQMTHRGLSKEKQAHKPRELVANEPNKVWCWDITYLPKLVKGHYFYLYMVIDIYSKKIMGYCVEERETTELASDLFKKISQSQSIDFKQLSLHADNGPQMKGASLVETLNGLGVMRSYSRPSVSNDNPYIESLFRTVKYCPRYPREFETLEAAREWVESFLHWYNNEHLHSAIKFITPSQRHEGKDIKILEKRKRVYEKARAKHPNRWSGDRKSVV